MHLSIQTSIFSEDIFGKVTQQNFTHPKSLKENKTNYLSPQTFQSQIVSTRCGIMRNQGGSALRSTRVPTHPSKIWRMIGVVPSNHSK